MPTDDCADVRRSRDEAIAENLAWERVCAAMLLDDDSGVCTPTDAERRITELLARERDWYAHRAKAARRSIGNPSLEPVK